MGDKAKIAAAIVSAAVTLSTGATAEEAYQLQQDQEREEGARQAEIAAEAERNKKEERR